MTRSVSPMVFAEIHPKGGDDGGIPESHDMRCLCCFCPLNFQTKKRELESGDISFPFREAHAHATLASMASNGKTILIVVPAIELQIDFVDLSESGSQGCCLLQFSFGLVSLKPLQAFQIAVF